MLRQAMMYLWQQIFGALSSIIKQKFLRVVVFTPQIKNKYLANPTPNSYHSDNKILAPTAQLYAHFFGLWLFLRHNVQIYFACKTW
jgi:hypothetical protein